MLSKLHRLGFSKTSLKWIISYLTDRIQYVQVDDRSSDCVDVTSGVPQGSILGPILFNLYVNDLPDVLPREIACHQYADDTTLYRHCKPSDLQQCESELQCALNNMSSWSQECNLALNPGKTKTMLLSTLQRSRVHHLHEYVTSLCIGGNQLERLESVRLLGTQLYHHLTWTNEITTKISSCYKILSVLRKLKHLAPYKIRKQLSECLVLSKLDYNDIVSHPIPEYLVKLDYNDIVSHSIPEYLVKLDYNDIVSHSIPEYLVKLDYNDIVSHSIPEYLVKLDYNDIVSHSIPEYLVKRLQRVQRAAAGFVVGKYATDWMF